MAAHSVPRTGPLAVVAVVVVAGALKLTQPVTLPLAAAAFLVVLAWPLRIRLERRLAPGMAYALTLLAVLAVLAAFIAAVTWSLGVVIERAAEIGARLEGLREQIGGWAEQKDLPLGDPGGGDPDAGEDVGGGALVLPLIASVWRSGAMLFLTIAFFVLALGEVREFRDKVAANYGQPALKAMADVGHKVRGFLLALTLAGLLGGAASLAYGWALGLEHALVWAFLAYLLNYVPVVGSTVAVFPPTLWALVQFEGVGRPLAVLLGFGAIQFVVGNYVAPHFESHYARVSPLVVLVSIVLWGWIWGPVGAVLGVPLTIGVAAACAHFESTRRIAALLAADGGRDRAPLSRTS